MSDRAVFYCWMSDHPNATNRSFIEKALDKAVKEIAQDVSIVEDPRTDKDTKDLAGSPEISSAILDKINKSLAVVCDVSIVDRDTRPSPNPNVMVELGYAMGVLGCDKVIMVMNTAYGSIAQLPFDIKHRRVLTYSLKIDSANKADCQKRLQNQFKHAVLSCLDLASPPQQGDLKPRVDLQEISSITSNSQGNFIKFKVLNTSEDTAMDVQGFVASRGVDGAEWIGFDVAHNLIGKAGKSGLNIKYTDSPFFLQKLDEVMMVFVYSDSEGEYHVSGRRLIQEARDDGRYNMKKPGKVIKRESLIDTLRECLSLAQIEELFGKKGEFSIRSVTKAKIKRAIRSKCFDIGVMIPDLFLWSGFAGIADSEVTYALRELQEDGYLVPYNGHSHDTSVALTAKGRRWVYEDIS